MDEWMNGCICNVMECEPRDTVKLIFSAFQSEQPLLISDCCVYLHVQVEHQTRRRYTAEHALAAARSELGMMPAL